MVGVQGEIYGKAKRRRARKLPLLSLLCKAKGGWLVVSVCEVFGNRRGLACSRLRAGGSAAALAASPRCSCRCSFWLALLKEGACMLGAYTIIVGCWLFVSGMLILTDSIRVRF